MRSLFHRIWRRPSGIIPRSEKPFSGEIIERHDDISLSRGAAGFVHLFRTRWGVGFLLAALFYDCFSRAALRTDVVVQLEQLFAFDRDGRQPRHSEQVCGGRRDIDDAAANEWPAVIDGNNDRASIAMIGDAHPRSER